MMTTHTDTLSTTKTFINGVEWEVTTFKGGRTEIYSEYADNPGMMQFLGYYDDLCDDPRIAGTVQPTVVTHLQGHRDYWKQYLPGAVAWLAN